MQTCLDSLRNTTADPFFPQVFKLFSIIAKWMTRPVPKIKGIASQIVDQYLDVESPIVSLHIRKVDKMKEG